jgi:carboxypeptidase T
MVTTMNTLPVPMFRSLSCLVLAAFFTVFPLAFSQVDADELIARGPGAVPGSPQLRALAAGQVDILSVGPDGAVVIAAPELLQTLDLGRGGFLVLREDLSAFHTDITREVEESAFHTYEELSAEMAALADSWSAIASLHQIGQSVGGRPLWALKISDNVELDEGDEPRVLLVGCHHAREWISVETTLLIARHLLEQSGAGGQAQASVRGAEIWVVPMLNPDGHIFSVEQDRFWRKNRRENSNGTMGVDLNRNYSYQWGRDNEGSSPNPGAGTYRGPAAFSEPECRAIRDLMSIGRAFSAVISYHNFSQLVLKAWGYTIEPTADESYYVWMSRHMAAMITAVHGVPYEGGGSDLLYLTNGDTVDWVYGTFRIPAFTIELRPGPDNGLDGFVNPPSDIQPTFEENLPAALWLIEQAMAGMPLGGDVNLSGRVDGIDLSSVSYAFGSGEGGELWLPPADLDGNGVVDGDDLSILAFFFGVSGWGVLPF